VSVLSDFIADQHRRHPGAQRRPPHRRGRPRNLKLSDVERQALDYLARAWGVPHAEAFRQCLRAVLGADFHYRLTRQSKLQKGAYFLEPDKAPEMPYREVKP